MKVSIITIVYDNVECIESCIQSVLNQTYDNLEHIIIDGGSNDGTQEKIAPYIPKLGYYLSQKDNGLYNALNKGILQATGDIVGILHSDDLYYDTESIQKVVDAFKLSNSDLVYANGMYVERENTKNVKRIYKSKVYKKRYLPFGWIPLHTTIYVKKTVFDSYGLYDENYSIASDYEISLRWFQEKAIQTYFLNTWVVKMRLGGKSTTAKLQKKKSSEDLKIIEKHNLLGKVTLFFKVLRKIPQYALPKILKYKI
jgi:glycosyltransferase